MRLQQSMKMGIVAFWCVGVLFMCTVGYVLFHFISKWW